MIQKYVGPTIWIQMYYLFYIALSSNDYCESWPFKVAKRSRLPGALWETKLQFFLKNLRYFDANVLFFCVENLRYFELTRMCFF